jgi:hypothetical protein
MGISSVVHLLVILLYPSLVLRLPEGVVRAGGMSGAARVQGTELVNLRELTQAEAAALPPRVVVPAPEVPTTPVTAGRGAPGAAVATPEGVEGGGEGTRRTNAELLAPGASDLRLWAPVDPERAQPSEEEMMRLRLLWELEAISDSAALAEELARRALDWTYTDAEGKRWGVSPGKLHLGDLTLPLPFGFGPSPGNREKIQGRVWEWEEIQRGAGSAAVRQSWKEREEAMRRRREAERKPDTTGVRR